MAYCIQRQNVVNIINWTCYKMYVIEISVSLENRNLDFIFIKLFDK